jgi:hypothetical protein
MVESSQTLATEIDTSEWIRIVDEAVEQSAVSAQDVIDNINRVLTNVNSQPGADTRPFHSYTVTAP